MPRPTHALRAARDPSAKRRASALALPSLLLLLCALAPPLSGCARVKPYERDVLSLRAMSGDGERIEDKFRMHWQESREGAAGGFSAAGGGCGCN